MTNASRSFCAHVGALLLAALTTAADAASFTSISQARSISISGQMTLFSQDPDLPGYPITAVYSDGAQTDSAGFGVFDRSVGLGALSIADPLGDGFGAGRAGQISSFTPQRISFEGAADVNLTGYAQPEAEISGSGGASSRLTYGFSLDSATAVMLTMDSEVGPSRSSYSFALTQVGGGTVWNQTSLFDADGNEIRSFTTLLQLDAGSYNLGVVLGASSQFRNEDAESGRAVASFTLSPVPEPGTASLAAVGFALLGALAYRRAQAMRQPLKG